MEMEPQLAETAFVDLREAQTDQTAFLCHRPFPQPDPAVFAPQGRRVCLVGLAQGPDLGGQLRLVSLSALQGGDAPLRRLIPLNESVVAASGGPSYLTNEHLRVYNGLMQKAAEEKQVVFLDLYSEFANENGELPEEASKDGVHLKSDYCKQWLEYLKVHTVDFETLYPEGTET